MNFKKFAISTLMCALVLFYSLFSWFVPIKSYASISYEQEILNYWTSYGVEQGIPYLPSFFQGLTGWSNYRDNYNKFTSSVNTLNYPNRFYYTNESSNTNGRILSFSIYFYDYITRYNGYATSINFNNVSICTYTVSVNSQGLDIVSFTSSLNVSNFTFISSDYYKNPQQYHIQFSNGEYLTPDNKNKDDFALQLTKGEAYAGWLLGRFDELGYVLDGDFPGYFDEMQDNNRRFIKNMLNDTSDEVATNAIQSALNGDWGNFYLGDGSQPTADQKTAITNTINNLQDFYNQNVDVTYDNTVNNYVVTPKNTYNTYTSKQMTDYYNQYIAYNTNNQYYNSTTDLGGIERLISTINANIINLHNTLLGVSTTVTNFSNMFGERLSISMYNVLNQVGLADVYTSLDVINGAIVGFVADFNAFVGGLGGVIAGAIGVAWADIEASLDSIFDDLVFDIGSIIDDLVFDIGDIVIGDSVNNGGSSSDDDTNNDITFDGLDSLFDDLNLKIKDIFDDFNITIKDLFDDIKVTIDNPQHVEDEQEEQENNTHWLQVRNILSRKIPIYRQCIEIMQPLTGLSYDDLIGYSDDKLLEENISTYSNSIPHMYPLLDGYIIAVYENSDFSTISNLIIPLDLSRFNISTSANAVDFSWYLDYKDIINRIIISIFYVSYCYSIIHKIGIIFGGNRTDNSDSGGDN